MEISVGKIYQGENGMLRKVEQINGRTHRTIIFQEMTRDKIGTGRLNFKGFQAFSKWAKQEAP